MKPEQLEHHEHHEHQEHQEHQEHILPNRNIDLRHIGGLVFYEDSHSYFNANGIKYTGMTTWLKQFTEEFNSDETAKYKAIKETLPTETFNKLKQNICKKLGVPTVSTWTKIHLFYNTLCEKNPVLKENLENKRNEFLREWEQSSVDGSIEHDLRERNIKKDGFIWNNKYYPYENKNILEITKDDVCVIPEIMVWNHDLRMCGLVDVAIFDKGIIHILDFKTNKKIEKTGFLGKKMKSIFYKHDDCNYVKYSAQLYGYQKMICDLINFEPGECWIISTKSDKYKRKEDIYIQCLDLSIEINKGFNLI